MHPMFVKLFLENSDDDGLGIQAVLEPASFTDARLRRAASAIVESVL